MKRREDTCSKSSASKLARRSDFQTSTQAFPDDDLLDEIYAEELQLQEALKFSSSEALPNSKSPISSSKKMKQPMVEESTTLPRNRIMCDICLDIKTESQLFRNKSVCHHVYCSDCIRRHVAEKIKMNITKVTCPDPSCNGVIGPEVCRSIVPKQVLERWENALCESLILGSHKFYCPFKDCSAMLVNDGGLTVTSSECPYCHRLFCAQCKVAWHAGLDCGEFKSLRKGDRNSTDIKLMDLAKKKKWKRCPKCNYFVEKTHGCNHIVCRCRYEFCYGCGRQYHYSHSCRRD